MAKLNKTSAGILAWREIDDAKEVLLVHPGGPYWAKKDEGIWSIPKGEFDIANETPLEAAKREFNEETGLEVPNKNLKELTPAKMKSGKLVYAFAINKDFELSNFHSNTFEIEWPPRSGKRQEFPEVDKAEWLPMNMAEKKILPGQLPFLKEI